MARGPSLLWGKTRRVIMEMLNLCGTSRRGQTPKQQQAQGSTMLAPVPSRMNQTQHMKKKMN